MPLNDWASLAVICILGALSPGPSLMVILSLTATSGRKAGNIASFGHGFGIFVYALMSATGLALVLKSYQKSFVLIQLLGALFLLYLGIRTLRKAVSIEIENNLKEISFKKYSNRFFDGFLIAILNPKIAIFFLSLFSQFLVVGQAFSTHMGMATLAGIIDTFVYLIMVSLVSTNLMRNFLSTYKKLFDFSFSFLLITLSISLSFKILLENV